MSGLWRSFFASSELEVMMAKLAPGGALKSRERLDKGEVKVFGDCQKAWEPVKMAYLRDLTMYFCQK